MCVPTGYLSARVGSECLVSGGERRNLYVCSWKRKVELNSRSASHTTFSTVKIHIVFPHDYICILKNIIHRVHLFAITPLCFGKTLPCVLCSWEHQFTDKKPMKPSLGPPWPKSRGVAFTPWGYRGAKMVALFTLALFTVDELESS